MAKQCLVKPEDNGRETRMSKDMEEVLWENQLNRLFKLKDKYLEGYGM